jgi:hypothetical protein
MHDAQRTVPYYNISDRKNHLEVDRCTLLWQGAFSAHGSTILTTYITVLNPELAIQLINKHPGGWDADYPAFIC